MPQSLTVLVHTAAFLDSDENAVKSPGKLYFLVVTNIGESPVQLTHVWVEGDPVVHVLDKLPKYLKPEQQYVTWVAESVLAHVEDPFTAFRVFTSRQNTFTSERNEQIPPKGAA